MNFYVYCDNKGCRKEMMPVVDKDTLEAFCTECGNTISNVHMFMRRQMVALGMTKKNVKRKQAWAVQCQKCKKEARPNIKEGKIFCSFCDEEMDHLSKPFVESLKLNLKKTND